LTLPFKSILQRQRIHYGSEHSDVVTLGGIHSLHCASPATPKVATTDNNGDIYTEILTKIDNLSGRCVERRAIKPAARWTG
jgi:hypothetical protein